jgi:hypothetical protein
MREAVENTDTQEDSWRVPPRYARPVFLGVTTLYWLSLYFYVPILSPYVDTRADPCGWPDWW